jgi:hypothetical protein
MGFFDMRPQGTIRLKILIISLLALSKPGRQFFQKSGPEFFERVIKDARGAIFEKSTIAFFVNLGLY